MATVFRRGSTWAAQWYRPDGTRITKTTGLTGKREAAKRAEEMQAEDLKSLRENDTHAPRYAKILSQVAKDAKEGILTAKRAEEYVHRIRKIADPKHGMVTVGDQVLGWIAAIKKRVAESTGKGYAEMGLAVKKALGKKWDEPLANLSHKDCESLIHALHTPSRVKSTANQHFSAFRRAIQQAVRDGLIGDNPAAGVKPLPEDDSTERAPFTPKEVTAMLNHEKTSDEWRGLILVGGNTGLREGDAVNLDTNLIENSEFVLRPKKTSRKGKANIVRIPISKPLKKWIGDRKGPLFPTLSQKSPQSLWYHFGLIMERAGVPKAVVVAGKEAKRSFHSLRHSFTTWLAEADIHPDVRKKLTGHSTDEAHGRYTHHGKALGKAIESLPEL